MAIDYKIKGTSSLSTMRTGLFRWDFQQDIDVIHKAMLEAGWTDGSPIAAQGGIYCTFGIPTCSCSPDPHDHTHRNSFFDDWSVSPGSVISFYDPVVDTVPSGAGVIPCIKGCDFTSSFFAFVGACNQVPNWGATVDPNNAQNVLLTWQVPGTAGNGQPVDANGVFAIPTGFGGGGYLLSTTGDENNGLLQLKVRFGGYNAFGMGPQLLLQYSLGGQFYDYPFGIYTLMLLATPNYVMLSPENDAADPSHAGDIYVGNDSLFLEIPYQGSPGGGYTLAFSMLGYVARKTFRNSGVGIRFNSSEYNGEFSHNGSESGMAIQMYDIFGEPGSVKQFPTLKDPFFQPALVAFSAGVPYPERYKLAAYHWDMYVEPSFHARGEQQAIELFGSFRYAFISQQLDYAPSSGGDGPTGTLWLVYKSQPLVLPSGTGSTSNFFPSLVADVGGTVGQNDTLDDSYGPGWTAIPSTSTHTSNRVHSRFYWGRLPPNVTWKQQPDGDQKSFTISTTAPLQAGTYQFAIRAWVSTDGSEDPLAIMLSWVGVYTIEVYKQLTLDDITFAGEGSLAGAAYGFTRKFQANNGKAPFVWTVEGSSLLPPSWSPSAIQSQMNAQTSGTDTNTAVVNVATQYSDNGTGWHLDLSVSDAIWAADHSKLSHKVYGTFPFNVSVGNAYPHIVVDSTAQQDDAVVLPGASKNVPYTYTFDVVGGTAPYVLVLIGSIAPGLEFGLNTLSGTPIKPGTYKFALIPRDVNGTEGPAQKFSLVVG